MSTQEIICIGCPMGCVLTVETNSNDISVSGNTCLRGEIYAKKEITNPTRVVTSTVKVNNGMISRVSVKTETDIPKTKIFECMDEIRKTGVEAPVHIGDVIIKNCSGTGIAVIATKSVEHR